MDVFLSKLTKILLSKEKKFRNNDTFTKQKINMLQQKRKLYV